jgi:hypothetical protein
MDTIFSSFAKKGGNPSLSNKRNFPCFIEMKTYFCFKKNHPINPTLIELGLDKRGSNYDNSREFCFRRQKSRRKKKASYKIAPVAISPRAKSLEYNFEYILGLYAVSALEYVEPYLHTHINFHSVIRIFSFSIRFFNSCFPFFNFKFEIF